MITNVYSEAINQRRTDNAMAQVNGQTTIYKTLHRKLKTGAELRWFLSYNTSWWKIYHTKHKEYIYLMTFIIVLYLHNHNHNTA